MNVTVNGKERQFEGEAEMPLLWFLRDELQLTGTKYRLRHGTVWRLHGAH